MKQFLSLLLVFCLILCSLSLAFGDATIVKGVTKAPFKLKKSYPENPVIDGISSTTGLPASGNPYTPIMMVLDNAEEALPLWGIDQADIMFQVPNSGKGATKLLALFADRYPEQAGGSRSARTSMLPIAAAWDAAFVYAGPSVSKGGNVNVDKLLKRWGFNDGKNYNILKEQFRERVSFVKNPHNLSCHVKELHDYLVNEGIEFVQHPMLFTDNPLIRGDIANEIRIDHYGENKDKKSTPNHASRASYSYDTSTDRYIRSTTEGVFMDRETGNPVLFANVIVLRTKFGYQDSAIYLNKHLVGNGAAEIFQNGRYIRGAWKMDDIGQRIIFFDENGDELLWQRGKSFIVVTNDVSKVEYE